ncbi:CinA family protein [Phenylobacterium sp. SCN 70-31]|uniref:CinA family protein n=1 Tax=Phenylobacterium sp. SCN 70-31 TaxID=1660129 RepID=UPI00086F99E8|nr:CinA family protein [Phenylobacterium sp. SCN 70-31]ODT85585.1 MAG: damage-inducible protein CinA [Phenylobacterium sp. SCN 70-31]
MAEALDPAVPDDVERLAREVLAAACRRDLRLATAESCTGGLLASLLTDIPGLSHVFDSGFVTYSDAAKIAMLDVPETLIATHGAVSEAVAVAMAEGALARSGAHLAVAVTGYADKGPGPAGLVHFACTFRDAPARHRKECFGAVGRAEVRLAAMRVGLRLMRDSLETLSRAP